MLERGEAVRRLVPLIALTCSLAFAGTALAVETYGGPRYWYPGEGAGSSWKSSWDYNSFNKEKHGWETTVTFIDNVSYSWNMTVRNKEMVTYTRWWSSKVKKGHCKAIVGYHWGGCHVA
jgi:hypothetical protein